MSVHTPIDSRTSGIPTWAIILTAAIALVAAVYLFSNMVGDNPALALPGASGGPGASEGPSADVGKALVSSATPPCTACHGPDLSGSGNFPSLHGLGDGPTVENLKDLFASNPDDWIELWIAGTAPEVKDINRNGMPAFGDQFSAEQLASIAAYLKTLP